MSDDNDGGRFTHGFISALELSGLAGVVVVILAVVFGLKWLVVGALAYTVTVLVSLLLIFLIRSFR